jgi:3-methylfumaryl-CoA hydratase
VATIDIGTLKAWIGRTREVHDDIHPFAARALAAALDCDFRPTLGDELPPSWHWLYFLEPTSASNTGTDGHPRLGDFLPPVPLPRRMWASGKFEILEPLRVGNAARRHTRIHSVELKQGKTGPLVFVSLRHTIEQELRVCIKEEQNLVYREAANRITPLPIEEVAPLETTWTRTFSADPVLLFRFSALTYNAHRIHYDRSYAMTQEFYPALVIHAPLLVTLLARLVADEMPNEQIATFSFFARRPMFDNYAIKLSAHRHGNEIALWTSDPQDQVGLTAIATLT